MWNFDRGCSLVFTSEVGNLTIVYLSIFNVVQSFILP